jgi:hypothetical protein
MACGDHIMVKRWHGLYYHHGIDKGDETVIHLAGEPLRHQNSRVCCATMPEFLQGGEKIVVEYGDDIELLPVHETIKKAEECLDQGGYNLLYKNCEHFATYCKTGRPQSEQVRSYLRIGATIVLVGVTTAGVFVASKALGRGDRKTGV